MLLSLLRMRMIPWGLRSQIPSISCLPMPPIDSSSITFQRLSALAGHLRRYRPPPSEDDELEARSSKVVSQFGFPVSIGQSETELQATKKAAVLVCLFEARDGHLRAILTKRSSNLSTHPGEVALPGGKMEEGDRDVVDTATREAKEEIGLDPAIVNVITILSPFFSKNILRVFPVIGILSDKEAFKPSPNTDEVETVFDVPLDMFLKDERRRVEEREWMGSKYLVHFFDYETTGGKYLIWGLTAGILIKAASVVYRRQPPFLVQNP